MTRHWLFMFRPETYELVKAHKTVGVIEGYRDRFSILDNGDTFVAYISRICTLDGYGTVKGAPVRGDAPILGERSERYSQRVHVEFTRTRLGRDAKRLLYGVSVFEKGLKTTPANLIMCKGGFLEITKADNEWLVGCMEGRIKPQWQNADSPAP